MRRHGQPDVESRTDNLHGCVLLLQSERILRRRLALFPAQRRPLPQSAGHRNQNFGFSLGGPIFKDRTFFFVAFEKQNYMIGLSGLATEPSFAWQTQALALLTANELPRVRFRKPCWAIRIHQHLVPFSGHR